MKLNEILQGMINGIKINTCLEKDYHDNEWGNPISTAHETIVVDLALRDSGIQQLVDAERSPITNNYKTDKSNKISAPSYDLYFNNEIDLKLKYKKTEFDIYIKNDWAVETKLFRPIGGVNLMKDMFSQLFSAYSDSALTDIDNLRRATIDNRIKKAFVLICFQNSQIIIPAKNAKSAKEHISLPLSEYIDLFDQLIRKETFFKNEIKSHTPIVVHDQLNWSNNSLELGSQKNNYSKEVHKNVMLYGWEIK